MHTTTSIVTTGVLIGPFGPLAKKIIMLAVDMTINDNELVFIIVPRPSYHLNYLRIRV